MIKIGGFQLKEPLPDLHDPHALVALHPWVDTGEVGTATLALVENYLRAQPLARLTRPGDFYDFTRYRPTLSMVGGKRQIELPNSFVNYARNPGGNDFLFFHLLEPHMQGEAYVDSMLGVLRKFHAKRYFLVGSMYDAVPHTRPILLSGYAIGAVEPELRRLGLQSSDYEGPTTITVLVSQRAPKYKMETGSLIVHLPQYAHLEKDYIGVLRLMELLCGLYALPLDLVELRRAAEKQIKELDQAVQTEAELKPLIQQLESYYDSRTGKKPKETELSPEIEKFLRDVTRRFGQN